MAFQHLAPFDPARNFVVRQTKRIAGRAYRKGDPLDKAAVPERLLRMLYDHHQIGYEGEQTRRDIQSAHPRRRRRDGGDAAQAPAQAEKGPAQRPIANPNRKLRARARLEAGEGGASAAGAGEAQPSPAEGAPAGDNQEAGPASLNAQAASPAPAPPAAANDTQAEKVAALVRDNDRPALLAKADKLPGFKASMSKNQLAQLIVAAGDGAA